MSFLYKIQLCQPLLEDNPGIFNVQVFPKNPHAIPELKTAIQFETEATCTDTLSKF